MTDPAPRLIVPTDDGLTGALPGDLIVPPGFEVAVPVAATEIAALIGFDRQSVQNWTHRGRFIAGRWTVSGHRAWHWGDVVRWLDATGRPIPDGNTHYLAETG